MNYIKENIITNYKNYTARPETLRAGNKSPALFLKKPLSRGDLNRIWITWVGHQFIHPKTRSVNLSNRGVYQYQIHDIYQLRNFSLTSPNRNNSYKSKNKYTINIWSIWKESALTKDFIRGAYCPHTIFFAEICRK